MCVCVRVLKFGPRWVRLSPYPCSTTTAGICFKRQQFLQIVDMFMFLIFTGNVQFHSQSSTLSLQH